MTTYGNPSRISVDVEGGGIGALNLDTAQKVVLFGGGDPGSGSAQTNEPTQVSGPGELESTFGADTDIVELFRGAAANGVAYSMLYGVMPAMQSVSAEAMAGGSGTLNNTPIIEDVAEVSVQNTIQGTSPTPVWRYESPPQTSGLASDEVAINPFTGEFEAATSDDYDVDYKYYDWQSAFDAATGVIQEQEEGLWYVRSEAESVVSDAIATAIPLRQNQWKMVRVAGDAEPNATASDGTAEIDVDAYNDALDNDALFGFGPVRQASSEYPISGAIAGALGSVDVDEPVLGTSLTGVGDLAQTLNVPDQEALEDEGIIPVSNTGAPSIEGNLSTSTETGWTRSYFIRRLADRLILGARAIARSTRGEVNNDNTTRLVESRLGDEIVDLVDDGVLEPNTSDERAWFVNAVEDPNNQRKLNVSFGFTPEGIVDTVEFSATINA
jgi:hypothetical protein